jgi:hypothetical protein
MEHPLPRRRFFVPLAAAVAAPRVAFAAGPLSVKLEGEQLRVSAANFSFLQGKALERLHDGATVTIDMQTSLLVDNRASVFRRALGRFVFSYDLWEEKYAVARLVPERRTASRMTREAAENWALENLPVSVAGLNPDRDFWVRVELLIEDRRDPPPLVSGSGGISLGALIELFSRTSRPQQPRPQAESGPFRLSGLKK